MTASSRALRKSSRQEQSKVWNVTKREGPPTLGRRPFWFSTDRSRFFCRDPLVVVEVRGVEPRSAEPFTPASPSAAISKHSVVGTLTASFPTSYLRSVFDIRSQTPNAAAHEATPAFRRGGHPPGGRAVTEGYSGSQCHLRFGISCWFPGC